MTTRTVRLYGRINDNVPTLATVWFDNQTVYSGQLEYTEPIDKTGCAPVATWQIDLNRYGIVPLSIRIDQGKFVFVRLQTNYMGNALLSTIKPDAVWPAYVPKDIDDLNFDYANFTSEEFFSKYQMTRIQVDAYNKELIRHIPSKENFNEPFKPDPKTNVKIDGVLQKNEVMNRPTVVGCWHYTLDQNQQLDCDYIVPAPVFAEGIYGLSNF
jgi:hypothetical protein